MRITPVTVAICGILLLAPAVYAQLSPEDLEIAEKMVAGKYFMRLDAPCIYGAKTAAGLWFGPSLQVSPTGHKLLPIPTLSKKQYVYWGSGPNDPVGKRQPNPWGLYDMLGNVWEWVQDNYDARYYRQSPRENPGGPVFEKFKLLRGSSWYWALKCFRVSYRYYYRPEYGDYSGGFRCALDAESRPTGRRNMFTVLASARSHNFPK